MTTSKSRVSPSLSQSLLLPLLLLIGALGVPFKAQAFNDQNNLCLAEPDTSAYASLPEADGFQVGKFANLWYQHQFLVTKPKIVRQGHHWVVVEPAHELGTVSYFFEFDFSGGYGLIPVSYHLTTVTDMVTGNYQQKAYLFFGWSSPLSGAFNINSNPAGWYFAGSDGQTSLFTSLDTSTGPNSYEFAIEAEPLKNAVWQWEDGHINYGYSPELGRDRGEQTLVSRTRKAVTGTVKINGNVVEVATLLSAAWDERQSGGYENVAGRWNGIQLSDGTELTVAEYIDSVSGDHIIRLGTFNKAPFGCENIELDADDIEVTYEIGDPDFCSSFSGKCFPSEVEISIPSQNLWLIVRPVGLQEFTDLQGLPFPPIVQAASRVFGIHNGHIVGGRAYSEYSTEF
jgi:hypothetical protein